MEKTNKKKVFKGTMSVILSALLLTSATAAFACTASAAAPENINADSVKTQTIDPAVGGEDNEIIEPVNAEITVSTNEDGTRLFSINETEEGGIRLIDLSEDESNDIEIDSDDEKLVVIGPDGEELEDVEIEINEDGSYTVKFPESEDGKHTVVLLTRNEDGSYKVEYIDLDEIEIIDLPTTIPGFAE